ncbi:hypothetical protein Tco_1561695 [Tanacetum coccineum]
MSTSNTSNTSNQQTLADSGANARPPMLEKGNYIPWESQFRRAKKAAKNHGLLALIAHSNASSSHPHANFSYSPQSHYVPHPPSVVDYDD